MARTVNAQCEILSWISLLSQIWYYLLNGLEIDVLYRSIILTFYKSLFAMLIIYQFCSYTEFFCYSCYGSFRCELVQCIIPMCIPLFSF